MKQCNYGDYLYSLSFETSGGCHCYRLISCNPSCFVVWRSHTHEREGLVSCFTSVCTLLQDFCSPIRLQNWSHVTLHAPPPRIEQAKQPTWTFEPEANVNAYDCTSSNVRKMITSSHSFGTNRSKA